MNCSLMLLPFPCGGVVRCNGLFAGAYAASPGSIVDARRRTVPLLYALFERGRQDIVCQARQLTDISWGGGLV